MRVEFLNSIPRLTSVATQLCADSRHPEPGLRHLNDFDFWGRDSSNWKGDAMPLVHAGRLLRKVFGLAFLICATTVISASAQTFTTLITFNVANGWDPAAQSLVQGLDGSLYGTTFEGGLYGGGTIFKLSKNGQLVTVHNFCALSGCADGQEPAAGLIQATDGSFYGTTEFGGQGFYPEGTLFSMSPTGEFATLYSFCQQYNGWYGCLDGSNPQGQLAQGVNGDIYGTTPGGGNNFGGVAFVAAPHGPLTILYSFCSQLDCADGQGPYAGLTVGLDGDLYGTTIGGGSAFSGTVFRLSSDGAESVVYNSCSQRGSSFHRCFNSAGVGILTQGPDGSFYGTGGAGLYGDGSTSRLTANGDLITLHNFHGTDGSFADSILQASDGNLYGTTRSGGKNGLGTIFQITAQGVFKTIHDFDAPVNCVDNCYGDSILMQATDGNLYGTYTAVAQYSYAAIFRLELGLRPFVQARPGLAKHSSQVDLLGQGLEGATSVSFNGIPASFNVISDTFILAIVPADANSGYITVTTASGTLKSNVPFHVLQ